MISVCSTCYLVGCMWSKAAARKTLYQFPDARCHLSHRGDVWMVPRWIFWPSGSDPSGLTIFSGILPDHQLKTYSEELQNKHQTKAWKHKQSEIWSFRPQYSRFESPSRCLRHNKEWTEWKNWKTRNHQMNHLSRHSLVSYARFHLQDWLATTINNLHNSVLCSLGLAHLTRAKYPPMAELRRA